MELPRIPPVTTAEIAAFPSQKSSEATQAIYCQYDYLSAYAYHTDLRVQEDGPAAAIGGDWEAGGQRQLAFLQAHGVTPQSRVLDFGCGTGRLARVLVPYLAPQHYTGIDLSIHALFALQELAWQEGWEDQGFTLHSGDGTLSVVAGQQYDVIWCYAVLIHLPIEIIEALIASLQAVTFGQLFFTYKSATAPCRSGLKQWACPFSWYEETCKTYGYRVTKIDGMPHIPQAMACLTPEER